MKTYRERTDAVIEKVEQYKEGRNDTVINGGRTLSIKRNRTVALWTTFAAACLAVVIALNLILFLPFPVGGDISAYKDSEYYGLISVVNGLTNKPKYKNNFEKWTAGSGAMKGDDATGDSVGGADRPGLLPPDFIEEDGVPTSPDRNPGNGNYEENTNNQVSGVTEADLLKRSDKYAFYLESVWEYLPSGRTQCHKLRVYGLEGNEVPLISTHLIAPEDGKRYQYDTCEMYLSKDCNTVTVISQCYDTTVRNLYTRIVSLDVSDVNDIKETSRTFVSGAYISSRLVDGNLLLFSNFTVNDKPDFSNEAQYLPQAGAADDMKSLPAANIIFSDDATAARYTVVCTLDQKTLEINSDYAFLSYSQEAYVSEQNIYLTRTKKSEANDRYDNYTQITCLTYADGALGLLNSAEVPGTVLNQYSMDEYDGLLRIVTEVSTKEVTGGDPHKNYGYEPYTGASLYCIDLESFEIRASLEQFSPSGEKVFSVRFDKTTAYVCTAIAHVELIDPVFAIDLSDLENITCKDTGTITGYSLSLMKFKGDTLLGIGYGEWRNQLKIELYRETENGVESVASFVKDCDFSSKFKAYYIDAENGLVGLSVSYYDGVEYERKHEFLLLLFDGYNLTVAESVPLDLNDGNDVARAFLADGYIYIFSGDEAHPLNWNA